VVKVIWQQGCITTAYGRFSHIWQVALIPNDNSISSAVFAQLMTESPHTLQWATLSPKIVPSHGGSGYHPIHDFLGHSEPTIQPASRLVQPLLHRWLQSVPILYNGTPLSPWTIHGSERTLTSWFVSNRKLKSPNIKNGTLSYGSVSNLDTLQQQSSVTENIHWTYKSPINRLRNTNGHVYFHKWSCVFSRFKPPLLPSLVK